MSTWLPVTGPAFLGLGIMEIVVIGFVALLVFGGRLPEVMRNLGRAYAKFRHGMNELTNPIRDEMRRLDVEPPRPAPGTRTADLPPPDTEPPPSYEDDVPPAAATEDAPAPEAESTPDATRERPKRTVGGAADEPPPV
jgi:TatA/E family protein of Tat protein translocase